MEGLIRQFEAAGYEVVSESQGGRLALWIYDPETDTGREIPPAKLEAMVATEMQTAQANAQAAA